LDVSRSIGDLVFKMNASMAENEQVVIAHPDIMIRALEDHDDFIVIATDGVWCRMSSQEAVSFVNRSLKRHGDPELASRELVEHVLLECGSPDNVSVIVVQIRGPHYVSP
jgi:serine/threonine protein phosphatase PrpC